MQKIKHGLRKSVGCCCLPRSVSGKILLLDQPEKSGKKLGGKLFEDWPQ